MWLEGCAPAGEIVNEILLSRAAWRRSRCRAQGWPHCFSSNPLPCSGAMQWRNGGKSLGWIPHISTHYGHFVDTDPDSGQGVRALASNQTVFILFWPICLVLHHISILINQYFFWHISNCSLVSLNLSLYLYQFPNSGERRRTRIVIKTKQNLVMTRIYILNIWSWILNIHAHKL